MQWKRSHLTLVEALLPVLSGRSYLAFDAVDGSLCFLGGDDTPDPDGSGPVHRDHDVHVGVLKIYAVILFSCPAVLFFLDGSDDPHTLLRIDYMLSDCKHHFIAFHGRIIAQNRGLIKIYIDYIYIYNGVIVQGVHFFKSINLGVRLDMGISETNCLIAKTHFVQYTHNYE